MAALGDQVRSETSPNHYSVFGRNGSRDRTRCMDEKFETWNPCGYDSMRSIYYGAKRTGNEDVLNFCARSAKMATVQWKPWIQRWGQPPGEDSRYPPCGSMEEGRGDTDPDRHINVDSICLILSDPDMRRRGGITDDDVQRFCDAHFDWIISRAGGYFRNQREYLRYGFVGDSLLGLETAYREIGLDAQADRCFGAVVWLFWHIFQDGWKTVHFNEANEPWPIWNYGDLEAVPGFGETVYVPPFEGVVETRTGVEFEDRAGNPFNYGWRRYGSQSWYDGYLFEFLRRFWAKVVWRTQEGANHPAARRAVHIFDVQFKWYHPLRRLRAPLGDFSGPGAQDFVNCKLHGWTTGGLVLASEVPMTVADWEALEDDRPYIRSNRTSDYHSSDGLYHEKRFQDPAGGWHDRVHKGHVGIPWNSPDEDYVPSFENRGNNYLIPDATMAWAVMMGDQGIADFALCEAFDYLHAASSSDAAVTKGKRLDALAPPSNQMGYARPWNWAVMCGDFIREVKLGLGE